MSTESSPPLDLTELFMRSVPAYVGPEEQFARALAAAYGQPELARDITVQRVAAEFPVMLGRPQRALTRDETMAMVKVWHQTYTAYGIDHDCHCDDERYLAARLAELTQPASS